MKASLSHIAESAKIRDSFGRRRSTYIHVNDDMLLKLYAAQFEFAAESGSKNTQVILVGEESNHVFILNFTMIDIQNPDGKFYGQSILDRKIKELQEDELNELKHSNPPKREKFTKPTDLDSKDALKEDD